MLRWTAKSKCFHHDRRSGDSWINEMMIDFGRKMFWCKKCRKTWFS